jgi:hypothetical protein
MPFTTAGTVTRVQDRRQFQGLFSEMWTVTITGADPASIAAGAEDIQTYTVPGLALGDMVLGFSFTRDLSVDADLFVYVSAANTLTIRFNNHNASVALDLAAGTFKVLVGRASW